VDNGYGYFNYPLVIGMNVNIIVSKPAHIC